MPSEIKVPNAGESITSAVISTWHKADGETVKPGDLLVTIDTDKVSTELTAEAAGTLKIQAQPGEEVKIGAVIGTIVEGAATAPAAPVSKPAPETAAPVAASKAPSIETAAVPAIQQPRDTPAPVPAVEVKPPQALTPPPRVELTVLPKAPDTAPPAVADPSGRETRKKMSPLRRKIAAHLVNAQHTAAILTTFNEVDMTEIMNLRKLLQDSFVARHGVKLGFMSFFVKAVVEALQSVPQVNGRIEGDEVITHNFYDIGVAVGTERGLVVPVLRDCDKKPFAAIEKDIGSYAQKAKEGRITIDDLQGGVFTISNGGVYGSLLSTPILNPPQSAILGMHAIQQRPVAVNGKVEIRPMMYLALSYDHRLVDGKEAVTFLIRIKDCIEQPSRLLLGA
ncbi:MAG TPA: 2-oxoglutarate dehydrogenase complex dihydrolipoyllysine-residue succinyltransferase [Verrucomicrobiales bacterium]|jgi:2-oxoglutarate dehydrogenase E2 component (dihydrolipoamide succinyltransferase)|nr:2-oxoglutarate dehydrogenase complex dihydrolipoyllysine-residue succinyltransferase [Verrucomicrobiales bacterium]